MTQVQGRFDAAYLTWKKIENDASWVESASGFRNRKVCGWKNKSHCYTTPAVEYLCKEKRAFRSEIFCSVFFQNISKDPKTNFTKFELSSTFRFRDYASLNFGTVTVIVIVITFYSPSCLGQETTKGPFGLRVKLPPAHLFTTHGGSFTLSL